MMTSFAPFSLQFAVAYLPAYFLMRELKSCLTLPPCHASGCNDTTWSAS